MADLPDYREQFRAYLEIHAHVLQFLVGQHFSLDIRKTAVLDKRYEFLESEIDMLQFLRFYLLLELLGRVGQQLLEVVEHFVGGEDEEDFVFGLVVEFHDPETVLTVR